MDSGRGKRASVLQTKPKINLLQECKSNPQHGDAGRHLGGAKERACYKQTQNLTTAWRRRRPRLLWRTDGGGNGVICILTPDRRRQIIVAPLPIKFGSSFPLLKLN